MTKKSGKTAATKGRPSSTKSSASKATGCSASNSKGGTDAIHKKTPARPANGNAQSKQSHVIALLERPEGASLAELMEATHWQPHSVRGVISAVLRKKLRLEIARTPSPESGESRYRIIEGKGAA